MIMVDIYFDKVQDDMFDFTHEQQQDLIKGLYLATKASAIVADGASIYFDEDKEALARIT